MSHCAAVKARRKAERRMWKCIWKRGLIKVSSYSSSTWVPPGTPAEDEAAHDMREALEAEARACNAYLDALADMKVKP